MNRSYIAPHIASLPKSGIRDFFELVNTMEGVISLGIGEPDFVTPWTIRESAIYSYEKGNTHYTSNLGTLSLRKAICGYLSDLYGIRYVPEKECIVTVGVSEALDLAVRALVSPGDEVIYHEPCYVSYSPEVRMAHGVPVAVPTRVENSFALDPADLEKAVTEKTKVLLLNFPCNPTGAVLNEEQSAKIAEIAVKHDLVVISDQIYSELTYEGAPNSIASYPGMKERTLFLSGFSKGYAMTGFRVGYACGPAEIIDAMMKIHQYSIMCVSVNAQHAACEALKNGRQDMEMMRREYLRRRNVIVKAFNDMGLPCLNPQGAFYAFPRIDSTGMSSLKFAKRLLLEKKVAVVPGTAFGECGEGFVRCSYATSMEGITTAMEKIRDFLDSLKK
ncbi:MAG: aminotransferase class I/II-fold pyridoxal phosphate-dependent enzyme [Lentisphaeria bacterium]|nr:aminotransferase class I/II-fold pyridoxal phosphate-dependent enzyme [Lentisphaeria bacterium]